MRVRPNIASTVDCMKNNASFFFEKILLKGIYPVDHILQQHKTMLQLTNYFFFWVFENLPHYNSYYTFRTARRELILIMTFRVEHATCPSRSLLGLAESKVAPTYPSRQSFLFFVFFCHVPDFGTHATRPDQVLFVDKKRDPGNEVENPPLETPRLKI